MTKPLFLYAGGKSRLIRHYKPYMPDTIDTYAEPFFGGGAMFIYVMETYKPRRVIINDINADIMNIYIAIRDNIKHFTADIDSLEKRYLSLDKPARKAFYMKIRQHHAYDYKQWSKTREAAVLYFLMKTGFNGIYQINKNTNGRYGTPAGLLNQKTQVYDRQIVEWWHTALQGVEISALDAMKVVYPDDAFIFYDPPYRGSFTSYGQTFSDDDQRKLLEHAEQHKGPVFLTNRDTGDGFFDNTSLSKIQIPVVYTAGRRKQTTTGYEAKAATELLLYKRT
jgi:DNA adenine methylase